MAPGRVDDEAVYDYVICGGGTSGCVLAGRLAEDLNVSILVVEAGADNATLESTHMAGGWSQLFGTDGDWNVVTEPMKGVNDRQVKCSRGRFLGGSSGVNGCLCIRGPKQDFDDWGIEGWGGNEVYKYMEKAETFHGKDWFNASKSDHGYDGPLHIEPHDLAPISERIRDSMIEQGLPLAEDMFTTGETPHGCGHAPRTHHQGIRSTAADFVTKGYKRDNITIVTETLVDKVIVEEINGTLRATGAALVKKDGEKYTARARREVIVSGGAYCSPTILMRSGIGAKDELKSFGIDCVVDLPGVGKNLMDHVLAFIFYETNDPKLTNDHQVYATPESAASVYQQWKDKKTGLLSTFPFGIFSWARIGDRLQDSEIWQEAQRKAPAGRDAMGLTDKQPHIEIWNTELYGGPKQFDKYPMGGEGCFALCVLLFNQHSRGYVTLDKNDMLGTPKVDHKYLDHPLDELVLAEGCRYANEVLLKGSATKDIVAGSWPRDLTHHAYTKREEWVPYVREQGTTCYHPSGTCKMASSLEKDPMSVVDAKLKVHGVEGLRVVDVSIMPIVNNGHTQMPAYAIGEKAADLIKADALAGKGKAL